MALVNMVVGDFWPPSENLQKFQNVKDNLLAIRQSEPLYTFWPKIVLATASFSKSPKGGSLTRHRRLTVRRRHRSQKVKDNLLAFRRSEPLYFLAKNSFGHS
jgi:hypothetical protein